jgi:hypothetical protein
MNILIINTLTIMKTKADLKLLFEKGDTPTQEHFYEWMDSYWHKDEKLPADQVYRTISANTTLDDSFHNSIVRITAAASITVPNTLRSDFNCVFDTIGNVSATFVEGAGASFSSPFGKILKDNGMCTMYKFNPTTYRLNGGLIPV